MARTLRYQISNWDQVTECLSNNSRNLSLSLSKFLDRDILKGKLIKVNHANYGVLFSAMIEGSGSLISSTDEEGNDLPFLTTQEILKQLEKFGFYIEYDVKSNLPENVIVYLSEMLNLGYDKISRIRVDYKTVSGSKVWRPVVVLFKSFEGNDDILTFDCKLPRGKFYSKLEANSLVNVTHETGMQWDWLNYIANISDLLDENIDPIDPYITDTNVVSGFTINDGLSVYESSDDLPVHESSDNLTVYTDPSDDSGG